MEIRLVSRITCPHCGFSADETMPSDACQWYYECKGCGRLLRPQPGDCCVFCSYGDVPCPSVQAEGRCCGVGAAPSPRTGVSGPCGIRPEAGLLRNHHGGVD